MTTANENADAKPAVCAVGIASNDLLPCPFCGSPGALGDRSESGFWAVYCGNPEYKCDVDPHTGWRRSREEAVRLWNTRHGNGRAEP